MKNFHKNRDTAERLQIPSTGISYAKAIKIVKSAKNSAKHAHKLLNEEHASVGGLRSEIQCWKERNEELQEQLREVDCKLVQSNEALDKMREAMTLVRACFNE